ncbi:MAG: hypothetical protein OHK0039_34110 [Bacteroidia bacterium]
MQYRVGQRVRLLHDQGEAVVLSLVDSSHVEIDLGDDFPIEVHINEIVAIDRSESQYLNRGEDEEEEIGKVTKPEKQLQRLGTSILEISLLVTEQSDHYTLYLVNPEPADMLYTCYARLRGKYQAVAAGEVRSGEVQSLGTMSKGDLVQVKDFYFQVLSYLPGKGHPHAPLLRELPWGKGRLSEPPKQQPAVKGLAWAFSLRENLQKLDIKQIPGSEFIRIVEAETPRPQEDYQVDLHIEALTPRPFEIAPSEILRIQLAHFEKALSDAILGHYPGMIVIHGVGEGKLRKAVHEVLQKTQAVKSFAAADPTRFGNGATKVVFRS